LELQLERSEGLGTHDCIAVMDGGSQPGSPWPRGEIVRPSR
jgi:hypothetical protein